MPLSAQARVQTYVKLKVAIANREFNVDQPLLAFLIIHFVSRNITSDLFLHLFSCGHRRVPFIAPLFTRQQQFFLGCHAAYRSTRLRALLVRGAQRPKENVPSQAGRRKLAAAADMPPSAWARVKTPVNWGGAGVCCIWAVGGKQSTMSLRGVRTDGRVGYALRACRKWKSCLEFTWIDERALYMESVHAVLKRVYWMNCRDARLTWNLRIITEM